MHKEKWRQELVTRRLDSAIIRDEFRHLIETLNEMGVLEVEVKFGTFWGIDIYDERDWDWVTVPCEGLESLVLEYEVKGYGELAGDDLAVRVKSLPVELLFCHESDIHLMFDDRIPFVAERQKRWMDLGYRPKEHKHDSHFNPDWRGWQKWD